MPLIKARYIMRPLTLDGGEMLWGNQPSPEKQLLVFTVQEDHPHDEVLILTQEIPDFVFGGPEFRTDREPVAAVVPDSLQRFFEARQYLPARLGGRGGLVGIQLPQALGLPLQVPQKIRVECQVRAEIQHHLGLRVHGVEFLGPEIRLLVEEALGRKIFWTS